MSLYKFPIARVHLKLHRFTLNSMWSTFKMYGSDSLGLVASWDFSVAVQIFPKSHSHPCDYLYLLIVIIISISISVIVIVIVIVIIIYLFFFFNIIFLFICLLQLPWHFCPSICLRTERSWPSIPFLSSILPLASLFSRRTSRTYEHTKFC